MDKYLNNGPGPSKDNVHLNLGEIHKLRVSIVKCEKEEEKRGCIQNKGLNEREGEVLS